ncbi:MAG: ATP-binding protein, partial [Aeromicrobium sp.]
VPTGTFIAEGLFAPVIVDACREAGLLDAAICLQRNPMLTFGLRLTRDLREGRKSPWVLVRRGWRLMRDEPRIIADAVAHGCTPMTPKKARALLAS